MKPQKPGKTLLSMPISLSSSTSVCLPSKPRPLLPLFCPLLLSAQGMETGWELVPSQAWEPSQVRTPGAPPWGSGREKVKGWNQGASRERAGFLGEGGRLSLSVPPQAWEGK